ncbi:hypothetical protein AVEN_200988-1 [Araneus ventricosus]|uniref:Uncharacterized protein n=1 Tax=Araneus ventricosus TaxID=182803 RepID=A0A4Y2NG23_ARAVE|nr:hypothetical protein AVEN_200988-1 [Araneus ventricosus]
MRNAAPILELRGTGYLHAHTQIKNLRGFASTILVPSTVASFRSQVFSSGGTGFRAVVSNSGSGGAAALMDEPPLDREDLESSDRYFFIQLYCPEKKKNATCLSELKKERSMC